MMRLIWATLMGSVVVALANAQTLSTKDRLQITFAPNGSITAVRVDRRLFSGVGGFFVAEPTDKPENLRWVLLQGKGERKGEALRLQLSGEGLELTATFTQRPDALFCEGVLRDTTGRDRAVVLAFGLPLDATGWQWWDNLRTAQVIDPKLVARYSATTRYGTRGEHSPYPFCALNTEDLGIAMGIALDLPVVHRFVYDATQKQLRLEWDFGLSPDGGTRDITAPNRPRRPSIAVFRFVVYGLDEPRWGFRAAADKFYRLFPESFRVRVKRFGIWMPFTDISKIVDFEDFGFAYYEGSASPEFNRKHGIYNFPYVEPWSAWFYLPPEAPTDLSLEQLFTYPKKSEQHPNLAEIVKSSGVQDEQGRFSMRAFKTDPVHWAGGQTLYNFLVNADPDLGRDREGGTELVRTKAMAMDETLRKVLTDERLDGLYFDGFGEWVMPNENYRRDHWRAADFPLTFSWRTKQPTQVTAFGIYEYLAAAASQLHAAGKLVMANGFVAAFPFAAHWLDVGGWEIRWTRSRDDFAFFDHLRVLAYRKPFLPLNNEFFDREFTGDVAEGYFQWALFYGFPPSCFAPGAGAFGNYWDNPEFHNRDRHLFRRYIPLIVRLCEAGWEPITHAWTDNNHVLVERFGRWGEGNLHFAVHNSTGQLQSVRIFVDAARLGLGAIGVRNARLWVLTDMKSFPFTVSATKWSSLTLVISGTLAPRETALLWFAPNSIAVTEGLAALAKVHLQRAVSKAQRRNQASADLQQATRQTAQAQPKALADWVQWLQQIQKLASAWEQVPDGANVAADFVEAQRIVGAVVREQLAAVETNVVMPEQLTTGELVRLPVDLRNTGKEPLRSVKLIATLRVGTSFAPIASTAELDLGDLSPKALRRELLTLKVPEEAENKQVVIQVAMQAMVQGVTVTVTLDEATLPVLPPVQVTILPFGGEPSLLVRVQNNTGEALKATISVTSPLEFVQREVTLKARMVTETRLVPLRPPSQMQLSSAQVQVAWSTEKGEQGKVAQWLSLIAIPPDSNLLSNGSFEEGNRPPLPHWSFYGVGYKVSTDAIDGKQSIFCESKDTQTHLGGMQRVVLKQTQPVPLILHGFSKGEKVFPTGLGGDYSIYFDGRYVDGTPLWGQIVPFEATGRWEWGWFLIVPEKPLQEAVVYALFRNRRGAAWFDGVGLSELRLPPNLAKGAKVQGTGNTAALTDGDWRTSWQGSDEASLVVELSQPQPVRQVALWWMDRAKAHQVRVEVWDGAQWRKVTERATDAESFVTVVDFEPVTTQRLRITLTAPSFAVRELEVR